MKTETKKRAPKRHVFGRLKGIEVNDKLWTLELTKEGLKVRERCHRKVELVCFDRLCLGGGVETKLPNGEAWRFTLTEKGLLVGQGSRNPKLVEWVQLANLGRTQMDLFPQVGGVELKLKG